MLQHGEEDDEGEDYDEQDSQQQVLIQGDDEDDDNGEDEDMQYENDDQQEVAQLVQSDKKREHQDNEVNDKLLIDLNELDDSEKQMLLAYLQDEYEKNPDQFQFPKEKLQEIMDSGDFEQLREHIQMLQQNAGGSQSLIKAQEMIIEDD